jgi:hypothetical protein
MPSFRQISSLKYDFDLYKVFSIFKNWPKFARYLWYFPAGSQEYRKLLIFFYFQI